MASLSCPDCGVKVQPEDLICFRCGANLPHSPGPDDDVLTPTISQRFIAAGSEPGAFCPNCGAGVADAADVVCPTCGTPLPTGRRRRISPVVMRITFPTGNVDIPAGTSVRFEPGVTRTVGLVAIGGRRLVPGLRLESAGPLDHPDHPDHPEAT